MVEKRFPGLNALERKAITWAAINGGVESLPDGLRKVFRGSGNLRTAWKALENTPAKEIQNAMRLNLRGILLRASSPFVILSVIGYAKAARAGFDGTGALGGSGYAGAAGRLFDEYAENITQRHLTEMGIRVFVLPSYDVAAGILGSPMDNPSPRSSISARLKALGLSWIWGFEN